MSERQAEPVDFFSAEDLTEYFTYLDELRASGETNMFGAAPYLTREFGLDRGDAKDVTISWMRTFSKGTMAERIDAALARRESAT